MTEIPEHLLKRSRERRAAMGLGGDAPEGSPGGRRAPSGAAPVPAAAAATPAPAPAAAVEEATPEPPKPEPVHIQAAKRRKRIPYWAMSALAALPLWGYVYVRTLEPPPAGEDDPLVLGTDGLRRQLRLLPRRHRRRRGPAPGFTDGAVMETFPDWRDQAAWVRLGTDGWPARHLRRHREAGRRQRRHDAGWPTLTDQEIAQVVLHERELGGEDVTEANPDYADLWAVARGEMTLAEAEPGPAVRGGRRDRAEDLGG